MLATVALAGLASSGSAFAETNTPAPWWALTSGEHPSNLDSGVPGSDEVQQLTVAASKGDFLLGNPETCFGQILELLEGKRSAVTACTVLPFDASLAEVQAALSSAFPERVVQVSGGPVAAGTGNVAGPVSTTGKLAAGSPTIEEVPAALASEFVLGQRIEAAGIPAGTTVLKIEGEQLTLSSNATATASGVALTGVASTIVTGVAAVSAEPFKVGQGISGKGIPAGTTIEALAGGTVTLSRAPIAAGGTGVRLGVLAPYELTLPELRVSQEHPRGVVLAEHGFLASFLGAQELELEGQPEPKLEAVVTQAGTRGRNQIVVTAQNLGNARTTGPVTIEDHLPAGLTASEIQGVAGSTGRFSRGPVNCEIRKLTCTFEKSFSGEPGFIPPFEQIEVVITVQVSGAAKTGEENTATVSGGGAPAPVSASHEIVVGGPLRFGFEEWTQVPENEGGTTDTQAGSHPFQLTSALTLNSQTEQNPHVGVLPRPVALPKNVVNELPPGLIGNPSPFAQCTAAQFATQVNLEGAITNACPAASSVGVVTVSFNEPDVLGFENVTAPIFNLAPRPGEPARFGFRVAGIVSAFLDTSVRSGGDYGVNVGSFNITQLAWLLSVKLTFWGVPGDPRHDRQRGWSCLQEWSGPSACNPENQSDPPPFLIMPSTCAGHFESRLTGEAWTSGGKPAEVATPLTYTLPELVDGCNHLPFAPEVRVTPDGTAGSSPTGLNVDVHVPQESIQQPEGLAESAVKDITVALPEGVAVNPAGGDGLQACSESLVGFTGFHEFDPEGEPKNATALFTPSIPEPLESGINFCPNASKIGTVTIKTPLLPAGQFVTGSVYLATQNQNPFGSLIALYIVAKDPISGTVIKLAGETRLTESGQIVTTFKNSPQLAFEDAELHFFGGERAPLATPAHCGAYTTSASFTPWSGSGAVASSSTFDINAGPNSTPCPGASLPFSPSLTGGTSNINAGSFSPLITTIGREDGQQDMQSVQLQMPLGVEGLLTGVKLCPEAQANEGTCGPESLIGETTVSAGVGGDPVSVTGGKVYLTEKYAGAPFGLSIVNPVKAGPFDLERDSSNPSQNPACDCVVVRAKIEVNPQSAGLTVTTDPSGPHAIPHLIDGIPVQIKRVNVKIGREHFIFNPTNCNPQALTGSIGSDEGALQPLSVPFQATNCAVLKFTPQFTATTSGVVSKANGASVGFHIAYPKGTMGSQSWFNEAKFEIPRQLPARLTTIQQACLAATFETNRAACPPHSIIGHGIVHTEVLPVPLEGPVYFVSHGGAKFPDAVVVLDGYGVHIELVGETFIDGKTGVTSATFRNTPDVPFESFDVTLPAGPFSEFGANLPNGGRNFCGQKLVMPAFFKASNGLEIHQNTAVGVTGCPKAKTRAQLYAAALKVCHKVKKPGKRKKCEATARKRYGPTAKKAKRATTNRRTHR
ncbi:MAG TPA: hypothetical protein VGX26_02750 [Solirubrobacteraceae bacterium]|jgi:hypothetical protein|nr:hypothetical protein [Solirubrobacteraceae bacterium]